MIPSALTNFRVVRQPIAILATQYANAVKMAFGQKDYVLPTKYLFDDVGSKLFTEFTRLSDTYFASTEQSLLIKALPQLQAMLDVPLVVDIGAGQCGLFNQLLAPNLAREGRQYIPIDIAEEPLLSAAKAIAQRYPLLSVEAHVADFETWSPSNFLAAKGSPVLLWGGNGAANLTTEQLVRLLAVFRQVGARGPRIVFGIYLPEDVAGFGRFYRGASDLFNAFRWNAFTRLNRELSANFDIEQYTLQSVYNEIYQRGESVVRPKSRQIVDFSKLGLRVELTPEDRIVIGITQTYTSTAFIDILDCSGWKAIEIIMEHETGFSLVCAE